LDNGPGIPIAEQPKLFKPFSLLSCNKKMNPNGHGLGLSICRKICRKLGGDIKLTSVPGSMTEFTFWVDVKEGRDYDVN